MSERTGPQYYPGANRTTAWYEDNYPGDAMESNVVVLHTTEGTSLPSYGGGGSAPNITAVPDVSGRRLNWYQHFRLDTSSRALVNLRGGVETNTLNVAQVELVGTCDPSTKAKWEREGRSFIFWPEAPEWALQEVAEFLAWAHEEHGVKLAGPSQWRSYPDSYGSNDSRMSGSEWMNFYGVCGHQHVPENTHGDPGSLDFAKLIRMAKAEAGDKPGPSTPTKPSAPKVPGFPGRKHFRSGARNKYVTQLGAQLKKRGFDRRHDGDGYQPGPRWTEYDRLNVRDFQKSDKRLAGDADGYPGPLTWKLLFS